MTLRVVDACAALNAGGARYLVMGGTACVLHGYLRGTRDVDILIERSRANAERVLDSLATLGAGFASRMTADELLFAPTTVIGDDPAVDLFATTIGVNYPLAAPRAVTMHIDGVAIPVLCIEDLIATKRTGRAIDAEDIKALESIQQLRD